jgi:RNA polymerase sigma-70 factor, ECF subfamily
MAATGTAPTMHADRRAEFCLRSGTHEEDVPPGDAVPSGAHQAASDADILAAQRGDEAAFRRLYHDVQPRLLRYLSALAGADAEDMASETWLQVTRDLHGFRGDVAGFRAWAARIGRNRAIDQLRRARRRPLADVRADELTDLADRDLPEETVMARLAAAEAVRLIATLPPDQAEAVLLRVIMDLDAAQAGRVLGKRAGAVRTAAHRGLRTLAQRLADETREPPPPRV